MADAKALVALLSPVLAKFERTPLQTALLEAREVSERVIGHEPILSATSTCHR